MAARRSRHLAASFLVTVAAVPICACEPPPPPPVPPVANPPSIPVDTAAPPPSPPTSDTHPVAIPPTADTPPAPSPELMWTVVQSGNGRCEADYQMACHPGATCNPPPAVAIDCPKAVAASSYPFKLTRRAGSQECTAEVTEYHNVQCPRNVHCNPPPPSTTSLTLPCPK